MKKGTVDSTDTAFLCPKRRRGLQPATSPAAPSPCRPARSRRLLLLACPAMEISPT
uniref:Uncharacterized protein n=1 Tax=Setaria italica TaxID=4555 RepID=K3YFN8_SETIT